MAENHRFTDIDITFKRHPMTGDVVRKYDAEAVKGALRNLLLLKPYEIPFSPIKGSRVTAYLFELVSPITALALRDEIRTLISNFEPRVEVSDISIYANSDDNGYDVTILYNIVNVPQTLQLSFFLERLR